MASPQEIKELASLIEPHLNGSKLLSYESTFLIKPMENYGSCMLALILFVKNQNGEEETMEVVAKIPSLSAEMNHMFQPEVTFLKENRVYTIMAPAFIEFQRQCGVSEDRIIDVFAKTYGARINFDDSETFDPEVAALILENLNTTGYRLAKRLDGFTHEEALLVLDNLAKFHAIPIAMRRTQPNTYNKVNEIFKRNMKTPSRPPPQDMDRNMEKLLNSVQKVVPTVSLEKVKNSLPKFFQSMSKVETDGPYLTFAHHDFWINNMMLKYDSNGRATAVKFIDFQIIKTGTIFADLVFFIFSSVNPHIVKEHLDEYLEFYFENFMKYLKEMGCGTSEYSFEKFKAALDENAPNHFGHCLLMAMPIHLINEDITDFSQVTMQAITAMKKVGPNYQPALKVLVETFVEKGWL